MKKEITESQLKNIIVETIEKYSKEFCNVLNEDSFEQNDIQNNKEEANAKFLECQKAIFKFYESVVHKYGDIYYSILNLKDKIKDGTLDGNAIISTRFNRNLTDYLNCMEETCNKINKLLADFRTSEVWLKIANYR